MKCQKCENSEVNFHFSSNVNGKVTETNLCSECAAESGYNIDQMIAQSRLTDQSDIINLNELVDMLFPVRKISGFMPLSIPMIRANAMLPFTVRPVTGRIEQDTPCICGCGKTIAREANGKVDEEINLRRELNAQMRAAVEKEEFEKAAELRDMIKELEKNGLPRTAGKAETNGTPGTERAQNCDSETTTQDSPTAQ